MTVKSDQIAPAMAILADVAINPAFKPDEIERARTQSVDAVNLELKDPAQLARLVDRLSSHRLDDGTEHFGPSTLAVVTMDTGNPASNVIPAETRATLNIRFNDRHDGATLETWLRNEAARVAEEFSVSVGLAVRLSGEAFLTPPGPLSDLVVRAVEAETGQSPILSTSGGTSDARFIRAHCPVVELGLVGTTMHQVDERVETAQVTGLSKLYGSILRLYFS